MEYRYKIPCEFWLSVDRIKRLSMDILENNANSFGTDFTENKKILNSISIVRSKGLKNEVAGYITNFIKKQIKLKEEKEYPEPKEKEVTVSDESD